MRWFKRLLCLHQYIEIGPALVWGENYWRCTCCGKQVAVKAGDMPISYYSEEKG